MVACGAIALPIARIAARRQWDVELHPLPPLLHNRPERIAAAVERALLDLGARHARLAVGYADCGSYGALDAVCARLGVARLRGAHCYDLFAGQAQLRELFERQPGSYVLTDFLIASFRRTVIAELGLDRYPQLRTDYFGNYTRVVWLAQHPTPALRAAAQEAAAQLGLPLETVEVGDVVLEAALEQLLEG